MSARILFFRQLNIPEGKDSDRSLLVKAGAQEQRDRLRLFLFSKAGIPRKPETGSWKRFKACHLSDNRARATGEHRQISIPDKKRSNSSIGVRGPGVCAGQVEEVATQMTLSDGTDRLNTGLAAENNFLIDENNFLIDAENPGRATDLEAKAYLAITWQRAEIEARFTCRDRRFPTPLQQRNNGEIDGLGRPITWFCLTNKGGLPPCYRSRYQIPLFLLWIVRVSHVIRVFEGGSPDYIKKVRLISPCQSETKTKNTRDSQMKQQDNKHDDFDSIADLIYRQGVFLEILIHRLAAVEATVLVLALHTVPEETLGTIKEVEDEILSKLHGRLAAEVEHNSPSYEV